MYLYKATTDEKCKLNMKSDALMKVINLDFVNYIFCPIYPPPHHLLLLGTANIPVL
jgi:hypothetical protein